MKNTTKKEGNWMAAAAFAEEGEFEMAREMLTLELPPAKPSWFERFCMAVAFAEEGLAEMAVSLVKGDAQPAKPRVPSLEEELRACGLRMSFGILSVEA